jgi:hypothetical protein
MTRQSSIIDASAKALSHFDRLTGVARESVRVMRAAESMALPGKYRWEFPEKDSLLKNKQSFEAGLLFKRRIVGDGSGRGSIGDPGWSETDDRNRPRGVNGRQRAAMVTAGARVVRAIPDLSRAMNALSQVESGSVGGAALDSRKYAPTRLASNSDASDRARASRERIRPSFADPRVLAKVRVAPSIRGVVPPSGVLQREFAPPAGDVRVSNDGGGRAPITINSSPTVVINAAAGGAVQHDVIGALRAHREELFDQLKRESARRERAQF